MTTDRLPDLDEWYATRGKMYGSVSFDKSDPVTYIERDYSLTMELYTAEFSNNPRARGSYALSGNVVRPMFQVLCPNLGPLVEPKHASRQRWDLGPMSTELENRWIKGGDCFGLEAGD